MTLVEKRSIAHSHERLQIWRPRKLSTFTRKKKMRLGPFWGRFQSVCCQRCAQHLPDRSGDHQACWERLILGGEQMINKREGRLGRRSELGLIDHFVGPNSQHLVPRPDLNAKLNDTLLLIG
ncbi:hypothetical protein [Erythrobacter litoralis]|uniref:hypothetical protein n=1 Tax=Erythrobacter litoralis TaxID=39960 RepID=UPI001237451C|nr:hypothetical protein [Erythrobacter litoralis]